MVSEAPRVAEDPQRIHLANPPQSGTPKCTPGRKPFFLGKPLLESDYAALEKSWITREIEDAAMLCRVDEYDGRDILGQKGKRDCAGIVIPYYWPGTLEPFTYRLRRDNPDWTQGNNGKLKQERKYLSPPNADNRLFIPPGITLEQLGDVSIPVAIVEGEKKTLALSRLANHEAEKVRFVAIGVAGVWNWRGKVGKTGGPKGERLDIKGAIADLSRIGWVSRKVFIVFDSNARTNESVNWARKLLCRELAGRGAVVHVVDLPQDCGVNGIDDLLAGVGSSESSGTVRHPRTRHAHDSCASSAVPVEL
jgi:hypothetical protein